ncbi:MAG: type I-U CRISPR-associated protein Csb2 [Methanothrix sp.]
MLAFEVEYLTGRVFAASFHDPTAVEWPPHPSRLFAALVAAYKECDLGERARAALEWLEGLPAPQIQANPAMISETDGRDVPPIFVPVNDIVKANTEYFPENRLKQPLWMPSFTPIDSKVWFIWSGDPGRHALALQKVAENVTYLGHSMSPVRVHVSNSSPEPTLSPDPTGLLRLRIPERGRLKHLEEIYDLRRVNTTSQPSRGREIAYDFVRKPLAKIPTSIFQTNYVFRLQNASFPPEIIGQLIATVRQAILARYPDPIPEVVSGHDAQGKPSRKPHLAITPMLDVGHSYADGHAMGFVIWMPPAALSVIEDLKTALSNLNTITLGRLGQWNVQYTSPSMMLGAAKGLNPAVYTGTHDTWASVTPVIFGRHPKKSQIGPGKDGGRVIAELCDLIGLPKPIEIRLGPVSAFNGGPTASAIAPPEKYDKKFRAHVFIRWAEPVHGPVLIGAGLFSGFGLCRPWRA